VYMCMWPATGRSANAGGSETGHGGACVVEVAPVAVDVDMGFTCPAVK